MVMSILECSYVCGGCDVVEGNILSVSNFNSIADQARLYSSKIVSCWRGDVLFGGQLKE